MFYIVWYHLLAYYLYVFPHDGLSDFMIEAAMPSLHIGVIVFILISGFYGIKPSIKGFSKLLIITMVYFIPLQFAHLIIDDRLSHPKAILNTIMFISNTPYWFIRTYLYLYLCAPLVNAYIRLSSQKQLNAILIVIGIIAVYFGTTQGDTSLNDGKNLVNFIFLYLLGYTIKYYLPQLHKVKRIYYLIAFLILNAGLVISLLFFPRGTFVGNEIWRFSFPYCSPILIFNASLLFLVFSGMSFYSKYVNSIAASMFAVYLLHCHPMVIDLYQPEVSKIISKSILDIYALSAVYAFLIMGISILIDKVLTPLWMYRDQICNMLQNRFER